MSSQKQTEAITTLYRIENPSIISIPNGETSHADLVGQWFSPNLDTALSYLRKSTQTFGKDAHPIDGAQLVIASLPTSQLDAHHVSRHPIAATMDVEDDNYIIPRDGSVETATLSLDETVNELRGQLGNFHKHQEAKQRIMGRLAIITSIKE